MHLASSVQQKDDFIVSLRHEMSLYGYEPVEMPIIQPADLFLTRAGDQIIDRLFTFDRHGQQLALRPEFTAASAYRYTKLNASGTTRWQFSGPIFIDSPVQAAQYFQQTSVGAELIGMSGPAADAEIIGLAAQGVVKHGIRDIRLRIGHTGMTRRLLGSFHLDTRTERFLLNHLPALQEQGKGYVLDLFERSLSVMGTEEVANVQQASVSHPGDMSGHEMLGVLLDATQQGMTMGGRTQDDIARRLFQKRRRLSERSQVISALEFFEAWLEISGSVQSSMALIAELLPADDLTAQALFDEWNITIDLLTQYEINVEWIRIQPHITRNWDYYTGIVFEMSDEDGLLLGGGGRYDELIALIGGEQSVPAVGFAYYVDQILSSKQIASAAEPVPVSIVLTPTNQKQAAHLAHTLRKYRIPVALTQPNNEHSGSHLHVDAQNHAEIEGLRYKLPDDLATLIAVLQRVYHG